MVNAEITLRTRVEGIRPWEKYWSREPLRDFLRNPIQMRHPSRIRIAELAAEYDTVLECGCATAIDYPYHRERGTRYTGIDITKKFVEQAQEYNPGIDVQEGTALDLSRFPDRSRDTVYCRALLEHMHDLEWPLAVMEMWRVADKQMILAFFGLKPKRHGMPVLERMKRHGNSPIKFNKGLISQRRSYPNVVDVIESLPDVRKWEYEIIQPLIIDGKKRGKIYNLFVVIKEIF